MPTRAEFRCIAPLLIDAKCQGLSPDPGAYRCKGCDRSFQGIVNRAKAKAVGLDKKLDKKRGEMEKEIEKPGVTANRMHKDWTDMVEGVYASLWVHARWWHPIRPRSPCASAGRWRGASPVPFRTSIHF